MSQTAYQKLETAFAQISALRGASAMLGWDCAVMMPDGASAIRGEQLAALAEVAHEKITDARLDDLLNAAEADAANLTDWQQANVREMRHQYVHENAVPADLVSAFTKQSNDTEMFWRTARAENNFRDFCPKLKSLIALVRETAQVKSAALGCLPYDALLDSYDPGMRMAFIDPLFADLAEFLPNLLKRVLAHQANERTPLPLPGPFPVATQKQLGERFMKQLGFDFNNGRLDVSHHPFCGGVPGDVRLTTRYREDNFTESFFGVLHETGHALYEMHLPEQWRAQPVGNARGMSLHESQSLFIEMQLSRTKPFLEYAAPIIASAFGGTGEQWSADNLRRMLTRVKPSLIRTSADEVTYPLHVILRYRLEKALLSGDLPAEELPGAWNEGMKELLGITPPSDADGCMQDIHWAVGSIGYFPTYTLGAILAANWYDAAKKQIAGLENSIQNGNFAILINWLKTNIHQTASRYSTSELALRVTGKPLDAGVYKAHLETRYLQ